MGKRDWVILIFALVLAAAAAVGVLRGTMLETGSWGLSFREPGAAPIGNAGVDQLQKYDQNTDTGHGKRFAERQVVGTAVGNALLKHLY